MGLNRFCLQRNYRLEITHNRYLFIYVLATPRDMPDLSSPTRDQIHALCSGSRDLTTGHQRNRRTNI